MPSNVDSPSGFTPKRHAAGGVIRHANYYIASALASNIFSGDAVIPVNTHKRINVAAATNRLVGVFDGCEYVDANGEVQIRPYWPTGTALKTGTVAKAKVYDDPFILFEVQGDEDIVEADLGATADIVAGAGSVSTGKSAHELDSSNIGTGTQLRIEEFSEDVNNVRDANFARVLVRLALHYYGPALTAI